MPDNTILLEAFQSVTKGCNGLLDPLLLPEGQAARLLNVEVRNGLAESRPTLSSELLPVQGRFQGAFVYELEDAVRWVVVVVGQVWVHNFGTGDWVKVGTFPTIDFPQAYFCQAGKYAVVQNGIYSPVENWPIIIHEDGLVDNLKVEYLSGNDLVKVEDYRFSGESGISRDYDAVRVPIGKSMAYGQGRLFVAVERYYDNGLASGAVGWVTGEGLRNVVASNDDAADGPDAMLVFSENDYLAGGGAFGLPAESGFITAMAFFRNSATGTGLGELIVLCRRGSAAFTVGVDRATEWGKPGFGQQIFQSSGSASPWTLVAVNSDLVYYGDDGLRSIKYTATGETSGGLASVPLSPEVSNHTAGTLSAHLPFVTAALADNYLFFTAAGVQMDDGSVAFSDLLPWDLANFQVSGESSPRVFSGVWRGALHHAVLKVDRGHLGSVYRSSATGELRYGVFYRPVADSTQVSVVRTGALIFKSPTVFKRIKYADLLFDRVSTDLSVRVRWRVDSGKFWYSSDTRSFKSSASASTGMFRVPVEADNGGTGILFEFAIEWSGHARLKLCLFAAARADTFAGDEEGACETIDLDDQTPAMVAATSPEE